MAQTTSYEIDNDSGAAVRARLNDVFAAIQSSNSGATPPADTAPGMLWLDTSDSPSVLFLRNAADSDWVAVAASLNVGRNILINGDFRINQRNFNGNWSSVSNGDYGFDRWKRQDASTIRQVVEAGNFEPNTVHTLSGTNITTTKITSPSSGNWNIDVPNNADRIQLEKGAVATPFERRQIGTEVTLCQRYYQAATLLFSGNVTSGAVYIARVNFFTPMRVTPTVTRSSLFTENFPTTGALNRGTTFVEDVRTANGTGRGLFGTAYTADAEL